MLNIWSTLGFEYLTKLYKQCIELYVCNKNIQNQTGGNIPKPRTKVTLGNKTEIQFFQFIIVLEYWNWLSRNKWFDPPDKLAS